MEQESELPRLCEENAQLKAQIHDLENECQIVNWYIENYEQGKDIRSLYNALEQSKAQVLKLERQVKRLKEQQTKQMKLQREKMRET